MPDYIKIPRDDGSYGIWRRLLPDEYQQWYKREKEYTGRLMSLDGAYYLFLNITCETAGEANQTINEISGGCKWTR